MEKNRISGKRDDLIEMADSALYRELRRAGETGSSPDDIYGSR